MQKLTCLILTLALCSACNPSSDGGGSVATANSSPQGQSTVVDEDSKSNILQITISSKDHTTLVAAVEAAGLQDVLVNAGPLTVFAPNNAAFEALPPGTVENLLKPENKDKLATIIKFHASPGKYTENLLKDGMNLFQATGHYIQVEKKEDKLMVGGAQVLGSVEASNGLVHVVDKVLLPPGDE